MKKHILYSSLSTLILCIFLAATSLHAQTGQRDAGLMDAYNAIKSLSDTQKMEQLAKVVFESKEGDAPRIQDQCCKYLAVAFARQGNLEKTIYWVDKCKEASVRNMSISSAMRELLDSKHLDVATKFVESKTVMASGVEKLQLNALKGELLFKKGNFEEAANYLAPVYEKTKRSAELYARALIRSNALPSFDIINKIMVEQRHVSNDFAADAKTIYRQKFGNDKRINFILDSISAVEQSKMEEKVAKMAVNQIAPNFELTNLEGKKVSLQSLRGKTVFIDFWATWCGPCVGSFPGMQKAVDHYKSDPSVVFLFVHSYERVDDATSEVKRYMKDTKYRFDVYMDLKSPVAKDFKVTRLPTKLVIDKDGVVKVRSIGFLAEDEAVAEVSAMVNLARK